MHHFISLLLRVVYAVGFGYVLLFIPEKIVRFLPQLLGCLLILESSAQLLELLALKLKTKVQFGYFILPGLIFLYGLVQACCPMRPISESNTIREIFNPVGGFSWLTFGMRLNGICCFLFLVSEVVISTMFFKYIYLGKSDKYITVEDNKNANSSIFGSSQDKTATTAEPLPAQTTTKANGDPVMESPSKES